MAMGLLQLTSVSPSRSGLLLIESTDRWPGLSLTKTSMNAGRGKQTKTRSTLRAEPDHRRRFSIEATPPLKGACAFLPHA
jgi:hypothetical protein